MRTNILVCPARRLPPLATLILAGLFACGRPGAAGDSGATDHPGGSVTLWTDSTELFMEHPALILGQAGKFAVHLTDLTDFAPLRAGRITLSFEPDGGGEGFSLLQEAPRSPGIYGPAPQFPRAGVWNLMIRVESPQARDEIQVPGLRVYASAAEVPPEEGGGGGIPFLKEQQWKLSDFRTAFAESGEVMESFAVSGTIEPAAGRLAEVAAPIAGLLEADGLAGSPVPGEAVRQGQRVVTLTPSLGEAGSAYAEARGRLREAEEEYARVQRLAAVEAVSQRRVHEADIRLKVARDALLGLTGGGTLSADGRLPIRSPIAGVVAERNLVPGSRVDAGDRLFTVVDASVVWLRASVPAAEASRLSQGSEARFTLEGDPSTYRSRRLLSVGSMLDSLSRTVTVRYEVANPDRAIRIGANAVVSAATGKRLSGVTIPVSAVLDEDGRPVAYVQVEGERFEKRDLRLGAQDGSRALVLSGIRAGERVVTGAAYQVRLASLSTSVPAHGHEH